MEEQESNMELTQEVDSQAETPRAMLGLPLPTVPSLGDRQWDALERLAGAGTVMLAKRLPATRKELMAMHHLRLVTGYSNGQCWLIRPEGREVLAAREAAKTTVMEGEAA